MKQDDRAKQFMPFSALKGYEDLIEETPPLQANTKEALLKTATQFFKNNREETL